MQKSQLPGKYRKNQITALETSCRIKLQPLNNNASDYVVKSKYDKDLQTVYINKIMLFYEFQKGGVSTSETPPGCATVTTYIDL